MAHNEGGEPGPGSEFSLWPHHGLHGTDACRCGSPTAAIHRKRASLMDHFDDILDLSRQITRGPLSPWFTTHLRHQVKSRLFLPSDDLVNVGDRLIKQLFDYRQ
ncbi:MAG: hypothetical protein Q8M31_20935 [Beijerinckiaceae bacterium]|nr:hypothetical protein [Beijerinckiaceae bacterium]